MKVQTCSSLEPPLQYNKDTRCLLQIKMVMTSLSNLKVTIILCRFLLVQEGKEGKDIPESLRLAFLETFSVNIFALSD